MRAATATAAAVLLLLLASPAPASAYIGPGAGFTLVASFLVLLTTIVVAIVSVLLWPFRALWRALRRGRRPRPLVRRLIIVGFDGQDPRLTDRFLKAGLLPHFAALARTGCYHRLATTFPSVSPVAWSSFSTGTNPGRHNIFDFLDRDLRTYGPVLSSTFIGKATRVLRIGPYRIPLRRPELRLLRKSRPFWSLLGDAGIWSTVLRVPITFPPDRFYGAQLSAMSVPDLLGTQGTFTLYTTQATQAAQATEVAQGSKAAGVIEEGGIRVTIAFVDDRTETQITGPGNTLRDGEPPLTLRMRITRDRAARQATIEVSGQLVVLRVGVSSDWIPLAFRAAPLVAVRGLCRMQVTAIDEEFSLYVTPIVLDPERPAMPISHPAYYATYLAKKIGPYSTLGLAEDTWALNEGAIDDETFLRQVWDIDDERRRMFFAALDRLRTGTLVCVFDATDRVQHMFWRQIERPAGAIEELYRRNDALLGDVMRRVGKDDVLMVISDHGFTSFRRGVNVNRWLLDRGYLALKPGGDSAAPWLRDVDWSRTRAYALGLTGLFLNLKGRERDGVVAPGEDAERLKKELMAGLGGLVDDGSPDDATRGESGEVARREAGRHHGTTGTVAIRELFDTAVIYNGPYVANAPDLLVGYNEGYRISWDGASGIVGTSLFEDNTKAWSGDHCVDPRLVPGVFFCNRAIARDDPALVDIAPTALALFGLPPSPWMEGRRLFDEDATRSPAGKKVQR